MTTNTNIEHQTAARSAQENTPLAEHVTADTEVKTKKVRTPGWVLFDAFVHYGVNGIGNIMASIWMARDKTNYEISQKIKAGELEAGLDSNGNAKEYKSRLSGALPSWITKPLFGDDKERNLYQASDSFKSGMKQRLERMGEKSGFFKPYLDRLGDYAGDVVFLSWGGHITNMLMWAFETKTVKPKLVRFFDNYITDPVRKLFGGGPSKAELTERQEIYHKLDTDMAGKSLVGVWGARFAGIITAIVTFTGFDVLDRKLYPNDNTELRGILRGGQAWLKHKGIDEHSTTTKADEYFSKQMSLLTSVEILGTATTASMQYVYLMANELFGVGPKTNLGDTKKGKAKAAKAEAEAAKNTNTPTPPKRPTRPTDVRPKPTTPFKISTPTPPKQPARPTGIKLKSTASIKTPKEQAAEKAQTPLKATDLTRDDTKEISHSAQKTSQNTDTPSEKRSSTQPQKANHTSTPKTERYEDAVRSGHLARREELEGVAAG